MFTFIHTSLWCLEKFYEGLKDLHKTFWGTTFVKIKIYTNFYFNTTFWNALEEMQWTMNSRLICWIWSKFKISDVVLVTLLTVSFIMLKNGQTYLKDLVLLALLFNIMHERVNIFWTKSAHKSNVFNSFVPDALSFVPFSTPWKH